MKDELTIKISGEAGQGIETIGSALLRLFQESGLNLFANRDYMSRIRGGNNFFQLRVSVKPINSCRDRSDITVALDKNSVFLHQDSVAAEGIIILDIEKFGITQKDKRYYDFPFFRISRENAGSELFVNSVCLGMIAQMTGEEFTLVEKTLQRIFHSKPPEIIEKNIACARAGFDFCLNNSPENIFRLNKGKYSERLIMTGHDALVMGAIKAGCKFYSGYPMTPSTGIMDVMARYADKFNIVVEQAEDEIAAINMAIGASFAGARSMTATSGGGFCLMTEGLSLAGMTETPLVVVNAQRPAPATGFPTRTEQGDLNFVLHAGHGEFARVVFSPGSIEECFRLTIKAFDLAEKYQIPALILTDQYIADSYMNIEPFKTAGMTLKRHIIGKDEGATIKGYKRYALNDSGISPRAIPSWLPEPFWVDSDEHTEEGHITEDGVMREKMVRKRFSRKMELLAAEVEAPVCWQESSDLLLAGFGSTFGPVKEACQQLRSKGKSIGCIHLPQLWPFPRQLRQILKTAKRVVTVENNAGGQLAGLLSWQTGIRPSASILKYDGRPFNLDYLLNKIEDLL